MPKNFFVLIVAILTVASASAGSAVLAGRSAAPVPPSDWETVDAPQADLPLLDIPTTRNIPAQLDSALLGQDEVARDGNGRIQVRLSTAPGQLDEAQQAAEELGVEITGVSADGTALQAWVPQRDLSALAALPSVNFVGEPHRIVPAENDAVAATSEGVAVANAAAWHAAGKQGAGVKVAIIDGGFLGYGALLGSDLPSSVVARTFIDHETNANVDGTTRHGTACAEIVHDMAPAAELYLLKIATDVDLAEAVDFAIAQGVDVISTSLTFVNATPGDGTGVFATMAAKAAAADILWVTASGNYAETHWGGPFSDGDDDNFLEYAAGQEINFFGPGGPGNQAFLVPSGRVIQASIRWDDWGSPDQDYDLHLARWNGSAYDIVASSTNPQTGQSWQRPTERITYVTSGSAAIYGLAIHRADGNRPVRLELFTPNLELDERQNALSLGNLADVADVLTVAALDVSPDFPLEDYSSQGPTNGPGGSANGGGIKPDLAAYANVDTDSYGANVFNGTSAATPHVAGAAALVIGTGMMQDQGKVRDFLADQAEDQGQAGRDSRTGDGRLLLGDPLPNRSDLTHKAYLPMSR